jgi:flagellar biogenesis protein FliO
MGFWEDPRVRVPGNVAVVLGQVAVGISERVVEIAVGSGLALVAVGTGHLLLDQACPDLGDETSARPRFHDLAA